MSVRSVTLLKPVSEAMYFGNMIIWSALSCAVHAMTDIGLIYLTVNLHVLLVCVPAIVVVAAALLAIMVFHAPSTGRQHWILYLGA